MSPSETANPRSPIGNGLILEGDARATLAALGPESVHLCVTSLPYLWLRAYAGLDPMIWGGDPACPHDWRPCGPRRGSEHRDGLGANSTFAGRADKAAIRKAMRSTRSGLAAAATKCDGRPRSQGNRKDNALFAPAQSVICNSESGMPASGASRHGGYGTSPNSTLGPNRSGLPNNSEPDVPATRGAGERCPLCSAWRGHWGQEPSIAQYLSNSVEFFSAVRRVLRPDATLVVNVGDTYGGTGTGVGTGNFGEKGNPQAWKTASPRGRDVRDGEPLGIPFLFAQAMQAAHWRLRSVVVWAKAIEFAPSWNGSAMPESPRGWRWERHKIKITAAGEKGSPKCQDGRGTNSADWRDAPGGLGNAAHAEWVPCPGCPKCSPPSGIWNPQSGIGFGGYILRRGQWRPTRSHEYILIFATSDSYFADDQAVRSTNSAKTVERFGKNPARSTNPKYTGTGGECLAGAGDYMPICDAFAGRNPRAVWYWPPDPRSFAGWADTWCVPVEPFKGKHYAAFPRRLVELCIRAFTSEHGVCRQCGAQWARLVETAYCKGTGGPAGRTDGGPAERGWDGCANLSKHSRTLGWLPSCACYASALAPFASFVGHPPSVCAMQSACEALLPPIPATVLDPCGGSGTTAVAAEHFRRSWILCEASPEYCELARARVAAESAAPGPEPPALPDESPLPLPLFPELT